MQSRSDVFLKDTPSQAHSYSGFRTKDGAFAYLG